MSERDYYDRDRWGWNRDRDHDRNWFDRARDEVKDWFRPDEHNRGGYGQGYGGNRDHYNRGGWGSGDYNTHRTSQWGGGNDYNRGGYGSNDYNYNNRDYDRGNWGTSGNSWAGNNWGTSYGDYNRGAWGSNDYNRDHNNRGWFGGGGSDWNRGSQATGGRDDRGFFEKIGDALGLSGKGPKNFKRNDDRIREDVCRYLTDDHRVDATEVDVDVREGEITLRGTVDDRRQKRIAEELCESVWGVKDVKNELRVQARDMSTSGSMGTATSYDRDRGDTTKKSRAA